MAGPGMHYIQIRVWKQSCELKENVCPCFIPIITVLTLKLGGCFHQVPKMLTMLGISPLHAYCTFPLLLFSL